MGAEQGQANLYSRGPKRLLIANLACLEGELRGQVLAVDPSALVILPAWRKDDVALGLELVQRWLPSGPSQIATVGGLAEGLHDLIDEVLEDAGCVDVVTTWHPDEQDAAEYLAACFHGPTCDAMALLLDRPAFVDAATSELDLSRWGAQVLVGVTGRPREDKVVKT